MRGLVVSTVVLFATPAFAKPPAFEEHAKFSLPLLLGEDTAIAGPVTSTGFVYGVRPELVFAWVAQNLDRAPFAIGVGPYAEAVGSTGTSQVWLGGGASIVGYLRYVGVALSVGLDADWYHAVPNASPVFGLFVGVRTAGFEWPFDFPYGLRVDVRPAFGPLPTTVIISAQLDLTAPPVGFLYAIARGMSH